MKELYLNAEMDVVKFAIEDVIATSGAGSQEPEITAVTGENEGEPGTGW